MQEATDKSLKNVLYVDTEEKLQQLCSRLQDATVLALDTEFVREKTYRAKLCLIQVASEDTIACIDPVALKDIQPFLDIIYDQNRLKVLHSARQDYELFYDLMGQLPQPLFDTQLAASLLGFGEQAGYATLVEKMLGVKLAKAHTRTNWCQRPLTPDQIKYASDDVVYLIQIFPLLQQQLQKLGRENWLDSEHAALYEADLFITAPQQAWKKVKGIRQLKPRALAAAKNIATWREEVAIEKNKPRRWILPDETLLNIAQALPKNFTELNNISGIHRATNESSRKFILQCVQQALKLSQADLPLTMKKERLSSEEERALNRISSLIKNIAEQHNISSTQIASRKTMEQAVRGNRDIPLLKGWRYDLAGKKVLKLIGQNKPEPGNE